MIVVLIKQSKKTIKIEDNSIISRIITIILNFDPVVKGCYPSNIKQNSGSERISQERLMKIT